MLQLVSHMHEAGAKVDEFVAKHGGTANVSDNEGLLQELIGEQGSRVRGCSVRGSRVRDG